MVSITVVNNIMLGAVDCLQPLDRSIFEYGIGQSKKPPSPYNTDVDLCNICNDIVHHVFGLDKACNASQNNCFDIYKYLVNNIYQ